MQNKTNFEKVIEFHEAFNLPVRSYPTFTSDAQSLLRARLILEETAEVVEALQLKDMLQISKELADLLYVVYGTAVALGIPMDSVFDEVHKSNMTKSNSRDMGGKIMKGDNYVAPDMERAISKNYER